MIRRQGFPGIASRQAGAFINPCLDQCELRNTQGWFALRRHSFPWIRTADQLVKVACLRPAGKKKGFPRVAPPAHAGRRIKTQGSLLFFLSVAPVAMPGKQGLNLPGEINSQNAVGHLCPNGKP